MTKHRDWLGEAGTVASNRRLKDARPYNDLFPLPKGNKITVKRNAGVQNTVRFIPRVVFATLSHTKMVAEFLLAPTLRQTCENIWQWVYDHIRYEKDETGKEQVRSPARLFWDRKGDCDCYTTFIGSVLENVRRKTGWRFQIVNRITKYGGISFQHIYPIVALPNGERIVIDCVTEFFDYEEPYSEKEDYKVIDMDLEYLNGIDGYDLQQQEELFGEEVETKMMYPYDDQAVGQLGKLKLFQKIKDKVQERKEEKAVAKANAPALPESKTKIGGAIKKVVHAVNKVNPVTLVLRNGLLASMKLNILNVAGRLKWTYLSTDEAKKKGLDMNRWAQTVKVRERLEKIFYGAGGMPENLRQAILTGKGNNGKEVSGLGVIPIYAMGETGMSLRDVIGAELFDRENQHVDGLGVVVPAATLAAASAAVATLSALLKQIGPLKDGMDNTENPDAAGDTVSPSDTPPSTGGDTDTDGEDKGDKASPRFTEDPIGWAKANPGTAVFAGVCIAAVVYGGYKWYQSSKEEKENENPPLRNTRQISRNSRETVYHVPLSE